MLGANSLRANVQSASGWMISFRVEPNLSVCVQVFRPVPLAAMTDTMIEPTMATAETPPIMTRDTVAHMRPVVVVAIPPTAPLRPARAGVARMTHLPRTGVAPVLGREGRRRTAAMVATMHHPPSSLATRQRRRWAVCEGGI